MQGTPSARECPEEVRAVLASLHIPLDTIVARSLVFQPEATDLVIAEADEGGKQHLLIPAAASAWCSMKNAATSDGVTIRIVSAFRTIHRQAEIVRTKLAKGVPLETILFLSAPPGYSEHHSGRAVDVTTEGVRPLETQFEQTAAFQWLSRNAARFGYSLSFPSGNRYGYAYEPWHWCFDA